MINKIERYELKQVNQHYKLIVKNEKVELVENRAVVKIYTTNGHKQATFDELDTVSVDIGFLTSGKMIDKVAFEVIEPINPEAILNVGVDGMEGLLMNQDEISKEVGITEKAVHIKTNEPNTYRLYIQYLTAGAGKVTIYYS